MVIYEYDYMSRRKRRQVINYDGSAWETGSPDSDTIYVNHSMQCLEELDNLNSDLPVRAYAWGLDVAGRLDLADSPFVSMAGAGGVGGLLCMATAESGKVGTYQMTYDGNGNVVKLLNASGAQMVLYRYGPFGEDLLNVPHYVYNPFRFSTKFHETALDGNTTAPPELYDYGFRWYHADLGRWTSRDPIGERGGINVYALLSNSPLNVVDALGLLKSTNCPECEEPCYCGPNMTSFFNALVGDAIWFRARTVGVSRADFILWLLENGGNLDWHSKSGSYNLSTERDGVDCPTKSSDCEWTYWLCGECVHENWIGNFMFAFLGRLFHIPDHIMNQGGSWAQRKADPGRGRPMAEPPWDKAGYKIARNSFDVLEDTGMIDPLLYGILVTDDRFCALLKADPELWKRANDTKKIKPTRNHKYPDPKVTGQKGNCERCPRELPESVTSVLPGGKLGSQWPPVRSRYTLPF